MCEVVEKLMFPLGYQKHLDEVNIYIYNEDFLSYEYPLFVFGGKISMKKEIVN